MVDRLSGYLEDSVEAFFRILRQEHIFMVGVASVTGFLVGVAAVAFKWLIFGVYDLFYNRAVSVDFDSWSLSLLWIPLILATGGLLVGLLNHYFNPNNEDASVAEAMKWAAIDQGRVPSRVPAAPPRPSSSRPASEPVPWRWETRSRVWPTTRTPRPRTPPA